MAAVLASLAADQALTALIVTTVLLTAADFVTGIAASFRPPVTFSTQTVATFIQSHVIARVLPIVTVALLGHWEPALMALAAAAAAAYTLETIGSIRDSLMLPAAGKAA